MPSICVLTLGAPGQAFGTRRRCLAACLNVEESLTPGARPHAYVLTALASHYYAMMTKHDRMPVLVGQVV